MEGIFDGTGGRSKGELRWTFNGSGRRKHLVRPLGENWI